MLSRTADNLYWLARYVERAEYLARVLEATLRLAALPLAYVGATNEWESAVATAGCRKAFFARYERGERGERLRIPGLLGGQPVLDPQLHRDRAHQCARRAHRPHHRDVGDHQRRLARAQAVRQRADLARGVPALPALGAGDVAALRRLGLPHHAAQRRLLVLAARPLYRARRQHRAHPRREVPHAAAGGRACRRAARLLPMVGDPAHGVGAHRLPLGLPREPQAVAGGRPPDPQRADAAVAGELLREPGALLRLHRHHLWPPGAGPAPGPHHPHPPSEQPHGGDLPDRPARIHHRIRGR